MKNEVILPKYAWEHYEQILKLIAEHESIEKKEGDFGFFKRLGFIDNHGQLTSAGENYYQSRFIKLGEKSDDTLVDALLRYPPAEAIIQLLFGVEKATVSTAVSIIKNRGFWSNGTSTSHVVNLLNLLNKVKLLVYSKKFKTIKVIHNPNKDSKVPESIYIDPSRPYSNIRWLKKILSQCKEYIYWVDKHFQKEALDFILDIADANILRDIKILSIAIPSNSDRKTKSLYLKLKKELANKNIKLTWYIIDSRRIKDSHDRWILTQGTGWNLPPVSSIISGQRSEIHQSKNFEEVKKAVSDYINISKEIQLFQN